MNFNLWFFSGKKLYSPDVFNGSRGRGRESETSSPQKEGVFHWCLELLALVSFIIVFMFLENILPYSLNVGLNAPTGVWSTRLLPWHTHTHTHTHTHLGTPLLCSLAVSKRKCLLMVFSTHSDWLWILFMNLTFLTGI